MTLTQTTDNEAAKLKLFELYKNDGYVNLFLRIRWWHANLESITDFVPSSGTVLDLGCGYGMMANYLSLCSKDRKVIGVELSERKLKYANKNLENVRFLNGDITRLKLPSCDAIVFLHVLHHLKSFEEQEKLLKYCINLLTPNGVLIIEEIDDKPFLKFWVTKMIDHALYPGDKFYFRNEQGFKQMLNNLNLKVDFFPVHKDKPLSHVIYTARKKG